MHSLDVDHDQKGKGAMAGAANRILNSDTRYIGGV